MAEKKTFLKQFWKEKKMVGSIRPSSRFLTEKMLENVDFQNSKVIIELGPGTGVFTKKIIESMSADTVLLVFELNDNFHALLHNEIKDPRVILIHDSAEKIDQYLMMNNLHAADVIISSLPFANFPEDLRDRIIQKSFSSLAPKGLFVQFQYSTQSKKILKNIFKDVSISFTPLNFPPAFVYTCKK
ncbi:MAG: phospholipid methyltransferase [Flavobacteriia bacterium]|nr:phospholipid methyltransferase [Flavobacteriia bacterium]